MQPARPKAHVNADQSISQLQQCFYSAAWTVEVLTKDYGEDLLVRIFENGNPTQFSFFVQAKSTDNIQKYLIKGGKYLSYPFEVRHLSSWEKFWEPVVLIIWDVVNNDAYWEIVQNPEIPISTRGAKTRRCYIPVDNQLDNEGLARIATRTKRRLHRFENERAGAAILIDMLEDALGVKIDYDPQNGWLIVTHPEKGTQVTVFGKALERVRSLQDQTGHDAQHIVENSIHLLRQLVDSADIQVLNSDGKVVRKWRDIKDMMRWIERSEEVDGS